MDDMGSFLLPRANMMFSYIERSTVVYKLTSTILTVEKPLHYSIQSS